MPARRLFLNRKSTVLGIVALSGLLQACATPSARSPQADASGDAEIVRTVQEVFDAMASRDAEALRRLLVPEVTLFSTDERKPNPAPRVTPRDAFIDSIAKSTQLLSERMHDPQVRVDGNIATLWAPYTFYRDDQFSHCGHDAFTLLRRDGRWVITALSYTLRAEGQCN